MKAGVIAILFVVGCAPLMHNIVRNADCVRDHWGQPKEQVILQCALTEDNARDLFDLIAKEKVREAAVRREVGCR